MVHVYYNINIIVSTVSGMIKMKGQVRSGQFTHVILSMFGAGVNTSEGGRG